MDYRREHCGNAVSTRFSSLPPIIDHWHDVVAGSILGLVISYFCYRQYYPALSSALSDRPYSPRIKDEEVLPTHCRHTSSFDQLPLHADGTGRREPYRDGSDHDMEIAGTVRRDGPEPLQEVER
jgi:diacylglycerol diphosphate phosphatase/phosphatidate phosphatase